MKRKYLLLVLTTSCLTALVFYACRKNELQSASSSVNNKEVISVSKAKEWFSQKHAADIETVNELQKRTGQRMASLTKGSFAGIPDWSQYHENAEGSINVAMGYGYFSNTDKVYFRDLVVSYDEDGYLKELIEQVEFDSAYLKQQIGVMGLKEHLRSYIDKSNFTGKVSLYTISNQLVKAVVFENGELKHYLVSSSKGMGIASTVGGRTYSSLPVYSAAGGEVVTDPDLPEVVLPPGRRNPPGGGGFWWPPFPAPSPPPPPPGPGPGYGGGGGYSPPTPPQNPNDPCAKAKTMKDKATEQTRTAQYADALSKIKAAGAANGKEHAIVLNKNGKPSKVFSGGENSISSSVTENAVAGMHNHPNTMPPSAGDVYTLIKRNQRYPGFATSFVVLPGGQVYALVVTDPAAAAAFSRAYPPQYADANSAPNFAEGVQDDFNDCKDERKNGGLSQEEANFIAMSYVLDTYNSGIAVLRQDANGNFVKQQVQASKNHVGDDVYSASNCP